MKKSAMLQAFKVIGQKPIVLLLILPIQAISVLCMKFYPDMSSMLDMNNLINMSQNSISSYMMSFMSSFLVFMLVASLASLLGLAAMFLLTPPSMELFRDGAAGAETEVGWYLRGLRKHWWKPIVASLVLGAATSIVGFIFYIIYFVVSLFISPLIGLGMAGISTNDINSVMGQTMNISLIVGSVFGLAMAVPLVFVEAMFATFLPALADKGFGEAFKLVFSKKGFRKVPKAFGGYLLMALASTLITVVFFIGYVLLTGIPEGPFGYFTVIFKYISSWAGVLSMLLASLTVVIKPAFQFCLYQQIKDEETVALIKE